MAVSGILLLLSETLRVERLAHMDRASASGAEGGRFEPGIAHVSQNFKRPDFAVANRAFFI